MTSLLFLTMIGVIADFVTCTRTSTNGHLSTTATFFRRTVCIHWFLFKPLYTGHFLLSQRWPVWRVSTIPSYFRGNNGEIWARPINSTIWRHNDFTICKCVSQDIPGYCKPWVHKWHFSSATYLFIYLSLSLYLNAFIIWLSLFSPCNWSICGP